MENLAQQQHYWDQAAVTKGFSHPLDLLRFKKLIPLNARILDYGCGQGRLCEEIALAGFNNVIGVDYSAEMIRESQSRYPALNFIKTDGYSLPFDDRSFDVVLLFAVLTCIPSDKAQRCLVDEVRRVLCPGGLLLISDYPLQADQRNIARYEEFKNEFESYGTFRLSDGGVVRHHNPAWFDELLKDYLVVENVDINAKTMNGNPAKIRQIWAKLLPQ